MANLPSLPKIKRLVRCACGCPRTTQSRFAPGHDATLAGMVRRVNAGVWNPDAPGDVIAQLDALAVAMSPGQAEATAREMRVAYKLPAVREAEAKKKA